MDSLDPSDSQRGYSSVNYVYLILLMIPSDIHIYLQSIGFMSCIRELLNLSNWQGKGPRVPLHGRYATLHSSASRQLSTFGLSSRLIASAFAPRQPFAYGSFCLVTDPQTHPMPLNRRSPLHFHIIR
jgi:hypothetical protein